MKMVSAAHLSLVYLGFLCASTSLKLPSFLQKKLPQIAAVVINVFVQSTVPLAAHAGMLTFPLPAPLKNSFVLVRAGECHSDLQHEIQTNPVKKLRIDNALTAEGRIQAVDASKTLEEMGFLPTYIWASNTERSYETAAIIARESQLGQNRIVPVFSDLDARSLGTFEGTNAEDSWKTIHRNDESDGIHWRAPSATDGTPSDSVADVLVRANQLVSTMESMYSGENIVIISPDSDNLSILQAALFDENPDTSLPKHSRFWFKNGEVRELKSLVKPTELLVTGQTYAEGDAVYRKMKALRVGGKFANNGLTENESWIHLWHLSIDKNENS